VSDVDSPFVDTPAILQAVGLPDDLPPAVVAFIERATGIRALGVLCRSVGITCANRDVPDQVRKLFAAADIGYTIARAQGARGVDTRPREQGPVIFYGNHPFGIADALMGLALALSYRQDTKVLANNVLNALDINRERLIWIDPFDGESRSSANRRGLRETLRHLRSGGSLLMFPAGACSHLQLRRARIVDPPWTPHLTRLVDASGAAVVPIYFEGRNSWTFQIAGLIHPMLRTALLMREFLGLSGRALRVVEGGCQTPPIEGPPPRRSEWLRAAVYALPASGS